MTQEEKRQFDQLQAQLDTARSRVEEVRSYFSSVVDRLGEEARLYRGLFWGLLGLTLIAVVVDLIRK